MRGRSGGRKGPNPLTRTYESNGPDVKIRGSAQQVADKYTTLARDAQSSGDRVMAENYLQHAEHYNRIIAAAQAQASPQQPRDSRDDMDDGDDEGETNEVRQTDRRPEKTSAADGSGPQPVIDGVPVEVDIEQEAATAARPARRPRQRSGERGAPAEAEAGTNEADDGEASPKRARRSYKTRAKRDEQEKPSEGGDDDDTVLEAAQ